MKKSSFSTNISDFFFLRSDIIREFYKLQHLLSWVRWLLHYILDLHKSIFIFHNHKLLLPVK